MWCQKRSREEKPWRIEGGSFIEIRKNAWDVWVDGSEDPRNAIHKVTSDYYGSLKHDETDKVSETRRREEKSYKTINAIINGSISGCKQKPTTADIAAGVLFRDPPRVCKAWQANLWQTGIWSTASAAIRSRGLYIARITYVRIQNSNR